MAFIPRNYNDRFVENLKSSPEPITPEAKFGVRIVRANVAEGEVYWRVIGIHHLLPEENYSNRNVYMEALDEQGKRIRNPIAWAGWTWEGRQGHERADPTPLDKPDNEAAGNISVGSNQKVSVWIKGTNRDGNDKSDRVENLHTVHPDEVLPDGRKLNTIGHHSFYVVFQRTRKTAAFTPPPTAQPATVTPPTPQPTTVNPPVAQPQPTTVTPPPPPPTTVTQPQPTTVTPPAPQPTTVTQSQPPTQTGTAPKVINHYLLLSPAGSRGRQTNLLLALNYILTFSPTVGFSLAEAKQARQVTIIGEGISPADQQALRGAGAQVEVLNVDPYTLEIILNERVRNGKAFGG